jgi:hypothetical protein
MFLICSELLLETISTVYAGSHSRFKYCKNRLCCLILLSWFILLWKGQLCDDKCLAIGSSKKGKVSSICKFSGYKWLHHVKFQLNGLMSSGFQYSPKFNNRPNYVWFPFRKNSVLIFIDVICIVFLGAIFYIIKFNPFLIKGLKINLYKNLTVLSTRADCLGCSTLWLMS